MAELTIGCTKFHSYNSAGNNTNHLLVIIKPPITASLALTASDCQARQAIVNFLKTYEPPLI